MKTEGELFERVVDPKLPIKITTPTWLLAASCLSLILCPMAAVWWLYLNWPQFNLGVFVVTFVILGFFVGSLKDFLDQMKISKLVVREDGLATISQGRDIVLKWEDVIRCHPLKHGIVLRYKGKNTIKIPATVAHFDEIKDYCFYRLEQIGTFEDGRKIRRDKYAEISWTISAVILAIVVLLFVLFYIYFWSLHR